MRYGKSLTHPRSLPHLCVALAFSGIFIAALAASSTSMKAGNTDVLPTKARTKGIQTTPSPTPDPCAAPNPPAQICGKWGARVTLKTVPVHISLLPDKRILYWGRDKDVDHFPGGDKWDIGDRCNTYTWDPADLTGGGLTILNTKTNLFCSSHSFLPDGRLLVVGGHSRYAPTPWQEGIGETDVNIFDYRNNSWTTLEQAMPRGRWYPSSVTLSTGETLFTAGTYWDGIKKNADPDDPDDDLDPDVDFNLRVDVFDRLGQVQSFTNDSSRHIPSYPYLHLAPDGRVFLAGPGNEPSRYIIPATGTFVDGPDVDTPMHLDGSAVVYDGVAGKILMVGGFDGRIPSPEQATTTARTIDLTSTPVWTSSAAMNRGRRYHTATVLPDGKVLVTGGTQCSTGPAIICKDPQGNIVGTAVTRPDLWTPPNGTQPDKWKLLAASPTYPDYPNGVPRSYHSIALLLPDARVLVGGGGLPAAGGERPGGGTECADVKGKNNTEPCLLFGHKDVEIFSPPYLFDSNGNTATQPVIASSGPDSVTYGQTFSIGISSGLPITTVALIRLPSVTHGFNFDQRRVVLQPSPIGSNGLSITIPSDSKALPPGHYMMFILDSNGVPSKAKILKVHPYDGRIEAIGCDQIRGWAWDFTQPNTQINLTLNFTGQVVPIQVASFTATVSADVFRQDLLSAGKGNGLHGFVYNVPLSLKDGAIRSVNGVFTGTNESVTRLISGALQCPASLFPTQIPTATASGEGQTWEQGTQFSSSVSGKITHLAFYKAQGETGTHIGRLWTDTGVPLAQVTFTNEIPSAGWQVQVLPAPVSISAGVKYRVTYNINSVVAKTFAGLNSPITNGYLTAHTSYFSTPAGTFPTTNSGSILFADIRFIQPMATR
jgi:hypothetical protein